VEGCEAAIRDMMVLAPKTVLKLFSVMAANLSLLGILEKAKNRSVISQMTNVDGQSTSQARI
jgi:hypothetical protein